MSTPRAERVADQIRDALAQALREKVHDPRVGFVTLTEIKLSPDLRHATVFVTVIDEAVADDTLTALNRAVPFLRHELAQSAGLRFTPSLRFVNDEVAARSHRVDEILDRLRDDRKDEPLDDDVPPVENG